MSETYESCKCGFTCVRGQLRKTDGKCPRKTCGRMLVKEYAEEVA